MSASSPIEWTESTWNPVTGCSKISTGCDNCYALRMAMRLKAMGNLNYRNGFEVSLHEQTLSKPLTWKMPRLVFVNSMSDLFHEKIPFHFIESVFNVMRQASHHTFQVLTKRSKRLLKFASKLDWPPNVWMGVTVESEELIARIDHLRHVPAVIRFLSLEPLLSPLPNLNLSDINWVIVGGESGPGARPMQYEWVESIRNQCSENNIAFFFKQWGGLNKKKTGRILNGTTYSEMPKMIRQVQS